MTRKWAFFPLRQFPAHQETWQALNLAGPATPLLSHQFLLPAIEEFAHGSELLAVCSSRDGVEAMAALSRIGVGRWDTFQPSQCPIGLWLQRPEIPLQPLLDSLLRALPGVALAVGITQQDPDLVRRPADRRCILTLDYIQTARVTLAADFDQYWKGRGKNLKQNMKRQRSRLEKDGIKTALEILTEPADVAQAIVDYGELESASWKGKRGTAIHPQNAQGRFYGSILQSFAAQGKARMYRYRFNDKVVAMDLCIDENGTLIVLKTAHDGSLKNVSPAFLMRQEAFRRLIEERRIKRIEFYGRMMDWHTKWSDEVRTMYHLNYYRWAALPELRRILRRQSPNRRPNDDERADWGPKEIGPLSAWESENKA